jgi:sRNA-binding protein
MTRFLKGTTDHDSDGKMGGSLKETDMAKAPKKTATKAAAKPAEDKAPTIKADGQNQMSTAAAEQAEATQKASKSTAESGMAPGPSPKEQRAAINEQFEAADEKGRAAIIDETQAGLGVRGY